MFVLGQPQMGLMGPVLESKTSGRLRQFSPVHNQAGTIANAGMSYNTPILWQRFVRSRPREESKENEAAPVLIGHKFRRFETAVLVLFTISPSPLSNHEEDRPSAGYK